MERPCLCRARDAARSGGCRRRGVGGRLTTSSRTAVEPHWGPAGRRGVVLRVLRFQLRRPSCENERPEKAPRQGDPRPQVLGCPCRASASRGVPTQTPSVPVYSVLNFFWRENSAKTSEDVLIGGSSKEDRVDDFLHFEMLCSELTGSGLGPIARGDTNVEDDLQVGVDVSPDFLFPSAPRRARAPEGAGAACPGRCRGTVSCKALGGAEAAHRVRVQDPNQDPVPAVHPSSPRTPSRCCLPGTRP